MEESTNHLLDNINLHDADVTEIRFEGEKVVFEIPRGLVDDSKPPEMRHPCRLRFTLDDMDDVFVYLSRRRFIFGRVRYFTTEISLIELADMLKKKKGCFEIVDWFIFDESARFEGYLYCGRKTRQLDLRLWTHDLEFIEDLKFIEI